MKKYEGLIAAPFTPMNEKGEVMYGQIADYHDFLAKNNITGVFTNGSTGETASLTTAEKRKQLEAWTSAAKNSTMDVINLVGGTSYGECIDSALHSQECGADAIAIVAPYYFKPAGASELAEFCAKIAERVPSLPVFFYHIPVLTGCYIPMYDFLKVAAPMIPNLAGIKFTHEDFMDFLSCMGFENGKYQVMVGRDENLLPALALGCRAAVGSTFNFAAPLYLQLINAYDRGDMAEARTLQQLAIDMIRLLGKYGGIATGKTFMKYVGFDFGGFRLPVKNMADGMLDYFAADVRALQMDKWFSKR